MKKKITSSLILILICFLALESPVYADDDPCSAGVFGGECISTEIESGQDTHRQEGTNIAVNHYEEEWGFLSSTVLEGYWNPQHGTTGVTFYSSPGLVKWGANGEYFGANFSSDGGSHTRYLCDTFGYGLGWYVVYGNGHWTRVVDHIQRIDIVSEEQCESMGGYMAYDDACRDKDTFEILYVTEEWTKGVKSTAVCQWMKQDGGRWFDSRDEYLMSHFEDITIIPWERIIVTTHFYGATVEIPFPCPDVIRSPYPRALVGEEAAFTVQPETYSASSTPIATCTPDINLYQVHIQLLPRQDIAPLWYWDERSFKTGDTISQGWAVSHTWDTASYSLDGACEDLNCDKPLWGPSLIGEWLPSYKVNVTMAYELQARRTWTDWYGQAHDTGWETINMQDYGYNTTLMILTGARDGTPPQPGAMPPKAIWECIVPVPVIESQVLLNGN